MTVTKVRGDVIYEPKGQAAEYAPLATNPYRGCGHAAADKVAWAKTMPWIGGITAYHVAKNFGAQVAKPDVHLQRLADREGVTAQEICERLAGETGFKVSTVDTILWRACAVGILNSKTGTLQP